MIVKFDASAKRHGFGEQKSRINYVEVLKKRCNAAGRKFCDFINLKGGL